LNDFEVDHEALGYFLNGMSSTRGVVGKPLPTMTEENLALALGSVWVRFGIGLPELKISFHVHMGTLL
jgi:hypothetical protein